MAESKHSGSCHCGSVRFEVAGLDLSKPVITCNCSMCRRAGTMLTFVPASAFTLLSGGESLTSYKFHHKVIDHLFCNVCGIKPFARGSMPDGTQTVAVNVRCLDGVEVESLPVQHYDGASS